MGRSDTEDGTVSGITQEAGQGDGQPLDASEPRHPTCPVTSVRHPRHRLLPTRGLLTPRHMDALSRWARAICGGQAGTGCGRSPARTEGRLAGNTPHRMCLPWPALARHAQPRLRAGLGGPPATAEHPPHHCTHCPGRGSLRSSSCLGRKPPRAPQLEETPDGFNPWSGKIPHTTGQLSP